MTPFPVRVIHDDDQLASAMAAYEAYFDAEPEAGTPEGDRFELLGLVIAAYEESRWPVAATDPVEVIRLVMEGRGYTQADFAALLGSRSRASEILNGRRGLSVEQIRTISAVWRIPAASLIGVTQVA